MKSDAVFEGMKQQLATKKDVVKKVKAVFGFEVTKDGKVAAEWSESSYCLM